MNLQYQLEKKGEVETAMLEAFLPVVGHAYAGNARKGLLPLAVSGGGVVLWIVGVNSGCDTYFDGELEMCDGNGGLIALGALGYLAGRVWGIVSALNTAREYNAALRQRLNISGGPGPQAGSFELRFTLSTR